MQTEYFGYMKRDPDDTGAAFWLSGRVLQAMKPAGSFLGATAVFVAVAIAAAAQSATPTPTPTLPSLISCVGDCHGDDQIAVDELLSLVNIALGNAAVSTCLAGDVNHDMQITIDEILTAVNAALNGCPVTPTAPPTPIPSATTTPSGAGTPIATATTTISPTASPTTTPTPTPTCFSPTRPPLTVSFSVSPEIPNVGDIVNVSAYINTGAGPPTGTGVYLTNTEGTPPAASQVFGQARITGSSGGVGGGTVTFEMRAVQPGTASVSLNFMYPVTEICDPLHPRTTVHYGAAGVNVTVAGETPTPTPATPTPTPTCFSPTRPPLSVFFSVHPDAPRVGDLVEVSASITTQAGPATLVGFYGAKPVFDQARVTGSSGGFWYSSVTFEMRAVQPGTATVELSFYYEITVRVCGQWSNYNFVYDSATVDISVAPGETPTPTSGP